MNRHPLMTVPELAVLFKRTEGTIRRWIAEQRFAHAFKVTCGGWYIPLEDVEMLQAQREDSHD